MRPAGRDDQGFALVVVVGVVSILTILAVSAMILSQQTLADVQRADSTERAFQAANAGFDAALARVNSVSLQDLKPTWPLTGDVGEGRYSVTVWPAFDANVSTYTVIAVGVYGSVVQTVTTQFVESWQPAPIPYGSFDFPSGYIGTNGQSTTDFWGPLSTSHNFAVKDVNALPSTISDRPFTNDIHVYEGQIDTKVGVGPMTLYANLAQTKAPISGQGFSYWSQDCQPVTMPAFGTAEIQEQWKRAVVRIPDAALLPTDTTGGSAQTWNTTQSTVTSGTDNFSWTQFFVGNGKNATPAGGLLTLNGILYIDGPITLPDPLYYTGRGTIVVRGDVTCGTVLPYNGTREVNGTSLMNTYPHYSPLSPTENLGIVTAGNITSNDPNKIIKGGNSTQDYKGDFGMAGTFYAGGTFSITGNNNQRIKGSMICQVFTGDKNNVHFVVDPDSPDFLPPHMPGADIPPTRVFTRVHSTWARE